MWFILYKYICTYNFQVLMFPSSCSTGSHIESLSLPTKCISTSMLFPAFFPHTSSSTSASSLPHIFCHFPLPFSMDKTFLPQHLKSCIKEHLCIAVVLVFGVLCNSTGETT